MGIGECQHFQFPRLCSVASIHIIESSVICSLLLLVSAAVGMCPQTITDGLVSLVLVFGGFLVLVLVLVSAAGGMKERPRAITGEPPAAVSTCHFSIIVNAHTAQACRTL